MKKIIAIYIILLCCSCKKVNNWLDVKRSKSDVMPSTVQDYQAILDNTYHLNESFPILGLVSTDNLIVSDANFGSLSAVQRNTYMFKKIVFEDGNAYEFTGSYIKIAACNIALEGLEKLGNAAPAETLNDIRGQALFLRSFTFYYLAQTFCKQYDPATVHTDLGLQLKMTSDPNITVPRSTLAETYDRIINDLKESLTLLPRTAQYTTRGSQWATHALLAKIYLCMADYEQAYTHANAALEIGHEVMDFNSDLLQPTATFPFPAFSTNGGNPEYIYYATSSTYLALWPVYGVQYVDSLLYRSYDNNDLRKTLYYKDNGNNRVNFIGAYSGTYYNFGGLAVNETYLIRAECHARLGRKDAALADLNTIISKRWKNTAAYTPITAADAEAALVKILEERRKELPFTGLVRWEDLRRLNKDPRFAKTIVHYVNNVRYELPPNDSRYIFTIPESEVAISGVPQNER